MGSQKPISLVDIYGTNQRFFLVIGFSGVNSNSQSSFSPQERDMSSSQVKPL
jgi:hypothetical protein